MAGGLQRLQVRYLNFSPISNMYLFSMITEGNMGGKDFRVAVLV